MYYFFCTCICHIFNEQYQSKTGFLWVGGSLKKKKKTTMDKQKHLCTFWCEVSVYYKCNHLYFSRENVHIYEM